MQISTYIDRNGIGRKLIFRRVLDNVILIQILFYKIGFFIILKYFSFLYL